MLDHLLQRHPSLRPCAADIKAALAALINCFVRGRKLLLCGNGGSAADCEHIAGELLKTFERKRPLREELRKALEAQGPEGAHLAAGLQQGFPAFSLCGHASLATAVANDVDPALVFAQLVVALGRPGDILLALSTSGAARNVNFAAQAAKAVGMTVIGLTGRGGGALRPRCDIVINAPGETTPEVQEFHLPVYHYLCRAVEARFFPE